MLAGPAPNIEWLVERDLCRLALRNAGRSVPLQLAAVMYLLYLALDSGRVLAGYATLGLGLAVAISRVMISRRYLTAAVMEPPTVARATLMLEANALLAGAMWVVATTMIYPYLKGTAATAYAIVICGSLMTAALFMSFAGRSFQCLSIPLLTALIAVSASHFSEAAHSLPLAVLIAIFGATMFFATREVYGTAARAVRHGIESDQKNDLLFRSKERAEAANVSKSQFLATMSHEIRTPMNGVLGSLELLRHSPLSERQYELVKTAASSGQSLLAILDEVLDHAKIEAGKLTLANAPMSLHAIASTVVSLFRGNAQAKNISLHLDVVQACGDRVLGDSQRLKQVLLNLVGNAVKFTERGGVTLRLSAHDSADDLVGVRFEVIDTGIGISADAKSQLFRPFHQLDGSASRPRGGTGLGLAISERIIAAMGGKIEIESCVGVGSTFSFSLSFKHDDSAPQAPAFDSAVTPLETPIPPATVLLVEDNPVNRLIAKEMLQSLDLQVVEAENGLDALEQLGRHPVDIVLMDCQMPVMDGYTAAEIIRTRESQHASARLPIVAVTANAFAEDVASAKAAGMDGHLCKPYTRARLREALAEWL